MPSIKTNILLNAINTATGILFPIITFPYAARILLPEGIGAVNFQLGIINYIVLCTSLGIPLYAVKEIARHQNDPQERNRATAEILVFSLLLCAVGYIAVVLCAKLIPQVHAQAALFYILSLTIIFNALGVNWFYQGIEDFKFITIRAIIIRTLSAAALFIFVHTPADLIPYAFIIVGSTVGNNIINFVHLRHYLRPADFRRLNLTRHIRPSLQVFTLNLIISLYVQLNTIMLGFMSGDVEVGYFTGASKINTVALTCIASIGTVLLPRCAALIENGEMERFKDVINKSLRLVIAISLPMAAGLIVLARPVIEVFCGPDYMPSIPALIWIAPIIIFVSLTNIMGVQILYPMNKIRILIWSVTGGAIANIILNLLLIPFYGATGAAISTFFSELVVLILQLILGRSFYPFSIRVFFQSRYIVLTALMCIPVVTIAKYIDSPVLQLTAAITIGAIFYLSTLYLCKDELVRDSLKFISNRHET